MECATFYIHILILMKHCTGLFYRLTFHRRFVYLCMTYIKTPSTLSVDIETRKRVHRNTESINSFVFFFLFLSFSLVICMIRWRLFSLQMTFNTPPKFKAAIN